MFRKYRRAERTRAPLRFAAALLLLAPLLLGAAHAAGAPPEPSEPRIPFKKNDESMGGVVARVIGGLVVVVVVGVGGVFLLKRYFPSFYHPTYTGAARIKLLEARRLTPKTTLFLIEIEGRQLLLGQSADRIVTLHESPIASASGSKN